ncbi:MAG: HD-like signal output (HDOD) protein [Oleiphilaceae bacterium]|jgi:HD-like signal output (HDOD) protein
MTDSNMPTSAQEWAIYLNKKSLPSPFRVGEFVLRKLEKESLSYAKLASIINKDPILSFEILTRVNRESEASTLGSNEGSKTLTHAISMLGIEGLKESIKNLPKKAISPKNITSFYYLRTLCTSLYAGNLARAISLRKKKGNPEDIYWSGLFLGAPIWYLWRFATPEMRLVRYAIRSNFKLPKIAEEEVLGDNLENITRAVSKELMLPKMAQECYQAENQPSLSDWVKIAHCADETKTIKKIDDRELKIKMQKPHFIVILANLLAHYSSYCWYSRATLRIQRILAYYLDCSIDEAITFSHEIAADMSRLHPLPGLMLPAAKLLIPPRKRTKAQKQKKLEAFQEKTFDTSVLPTAVIQAQEQEAKLLSQENKVIPQPSLKDTRSPTETNKTKSPSEPLQKKTQDPAKTLEQANKPKNNPLYEELTHLMANKPEDFADFHELMNASTQGIAYGIELKRSFVALISKDGSRFKTYYTVGCSEFEPLKSFDSQIVKGTIFHKLCERPASIWIKPSSEKKIKDLIPMKFNRAIDVNDFFLMSVFVGKKPVAIFYGDNMNGNTLTDKNYNQFKFLCGAVSSALQYQAKTSKKPVQKDT